MEDKELIELLGLTKWHALEKKSIEGKYIDINGICAPYLEQSKKSGFIIFPLELLIVFVEESLSSV